MGSIFLGLLSADPFLGIFSECRLQGALLRAPYSIAARLTDDLF